MDEGTQSDPFDSLEDVPSLSEGDAVLLERGSTFHGVLTPTADDVEVLTYGSGPPPVIDCKNELPDADWTLETGSTYKQQRQGESKDGRGEGNSEPRVFEDGNELARKTSISDVDANSGSFYVDTSSDPWTIYLNPTGSTDPSADGNLYEWTARDFAIHGGGGSAAGLHPTTVRGVVGQDQLAADGAIIVPGEGRIEQCMVERGGKHHFLHGGDGITKDSIAYGKSKNFRGIPLVYFQPNSDSLSDLPVKVERYGNIKTVGPCLSTNAHGGFKDADIRYSWAYDSEGPFASSGARFEGIYIEECNNPINNSNVEVVGGVFHGFGSPQSNNEMKGDLTIRDSLIVNQRMTRIPQSSQTVTVEDSTIIRQQNNHIFDDDRSNSPSIQLNRCLIIGNPIAGTYNISGGDRCIFVALSDQYEVQFGSFNGTLSDFQSNTGAFSNSVFCTMDQLGSLFQGDYLKGDVRIADDAKVTNASGTVLSEMPDGTPLQDIGQQRHPDFESKTMVDGALPQWPTPPKTQQEARDFISDPSSHDWQKPVQRKTEDVDLGASLVAYYEMSSTGDEPDQTGQNAALPEGGKTIAQKSGPSWPYRECVDGGGRFQIDVNNLNGPLDGHGGRFWLAAPMRVRITGQSGTACTLFRDFSKRGWQINYDDATAEYDMLLHRDGSAAEAFSPGAEVGKWQIVQMWVNPVTGVRGLRIDDTEIIRQPSSLLNFAGARSNVDFIIGRNVPLDIGPLMIANASPDKEDREWLYNNGVYRSLPEVQGRTVTQELA